MNLALINRPKRAYDVKAGDFVIHHGRVHTVEKVTYDGFYEKYEFVTDLTVFEYPEASTVNTVEAVIRL